VTSIDGLIAYAGGDLKFGQWSEELQRFYVESFNAAGGDLLLMCGPALPSALSVEGLVDEYMLDVYPIAVGRGVHFFRDIPGPIALSQVNSLRFPQGVDVHVYEPQDDFEGPA
jgi:dihydrofolate reductase